MLALHKNGKSEEASKEEKEQDKAVHAFKGQVEGDELHPKLVLRERIPEYAINSKSRGRPRMVYGKGKGNRNGKYPENATRKTTSFKSGDLHMKLGKKKKRKQRLSGEREKANPDRIIPLGLRTQIGLKLAARIKKRVDR